MTPTDLAAWKNEFTLDPEHIGYANKSHEEIEKLLRTTDRIVPDEASMPVLSLLDIPEYIALMQSNATDAPEKREMLGHLFAMGEIEPARKTTRDAITFIFGAGSATLAKVKRNKKGRRHEELGLPMPSTSDIADALLRT